MGDLRDPESLPLGIRAFLPPRQKETAFTGFARFVADDMFPEDTLGRYLEVYEHDSGTIWTGAIPAGRYRDVLVRDRFRWGAYGSRAPGHECAMATLSGGKSLGRLRMPAVTTPSTCRCP